MSSPVCHTHRAGHKHFFSANTSKAKSARDMPMSSCCRFAHTKQVTTMLSWQAHSHQKQQVQETCPCQAAAVVHTQSRSQTLYLGKHTLIKSNKCKRHACVRLLQVCTHRVGHKHLIFWQAHSHQKQQVQETFLCQAAAVVHT